MDDLGKAVLAIFVVSLGASVAASLCGARDFAFWLGVPAVLLSGLAFMGHLVTLDDEMSGGWSNPEGSRSIWYASLRDLLLKLCVFAGAATWLGIVG